MCVHLYIVHVCMHICTYVCAYACIYACAYCAQCMWACVYYVCIYIYVLCICVCAYSVYVCVYCISCICACMHVYCVCVPMCVHVCTCVYIHTCVCVCVWQSRLKRIDLQPSPHESLMLSLLCSPKDAVCKIHRSWVALKFLWHLEVENSLWRAATSAGGPDVGSGPRET